MTEQRTLTTVRWNDASGLEFDGFASGVTWNGWDEIYVTEEVRDQLRAAWFMETDVCCPHPFAAHDLEAERCLGPVEVDGAHVHSCPCTDFSDGASNVTIAPTVEIGGQKLVYLAGYCTSIAEPPTEREATIIPLNAPERLEVERAAETFTAEATEALPEEDGMPIESDPFLEQGECTHRFQEMCAESGEHVFYHFDVEVWDGRGTYYREDIVAWSAKIAAFIALQNHGLHFDPLARAEATRTRIEVF